MKNEDASLGERLKRYGQVGRAATSLFPKMFGKSLGFSINEEAHAEEIREALGNLKGPLMKIAQIMGTVPEILPEGYAEELRMLQSNAPSMGWPFVRRRMVSELGPQWSELFEMFEHTATFAASLGQVHKAIDKKGQILALKLQYPNMQSIVEADLAQFKILLNLYEKFAQGLGTEEIFLEIKERLLEELDYESEAHNARMYFKMLENYENIHVPVVIPELTTKRLLALSWEEGDSLLSFKEGSQDIRNRLSQNLFHAWYYPLYHYGVLHGDPHLGNYTGRKDGSINLLDFGCIRIFKPEFLKGVIDLYHALLKNDQDLMVAAYESWGFQDLQKSLIEILNLWARFLYGPLLFDKSLSLWEVSDPTKGKNVASQVHTELKKAGGLAPPREFVFMDRAAVGLGSVFMRLGAHLNWHQLFEALIQDFDVNKVYVRQRSLLEGS